MATILLLNPPARRLVLRDSYCSKESKAGYLYHPVDLMVQWGQKDSYYQMDAEGLIERTEKIAGFLGYHDHFFVDRHPDMGHRFSNQEIADFFHARFGDGAWKPE